MSGEIDKHLGGTQLAPKAADKPDLVPDYPLLPTRRRFWELALRAIDRAGKAGVLRTQLRIVHEAAARVADAPVGHVVGADFLYDEQSPGMLQSGVLLREIDEPRRQACARFPRDSAAAPPLRRRARRFHGARSSPPVATVARIWHEREDWEDPEPARRP